MSIKNGSKPLEIKPTTKLASNSFFRGKTTQFALTAFFALFLTYLLWTPFFPSYNRILASAVNPLINFMENSKVSRTFAKKDFLIITRSDMNPDSPAITPVNFRPYQLSIILLLTLILATPQIPFFKKLKLIPTGIALVFVYQTFTISNQIMFIFSTQLGEYSNITYSDFQRNLFGTIDAFNIGIGIYFIPILFWLASTYSYIFLGNRSANPSQKIGRNDACQCGSGRKFKKCCAIS